VPYQTVELPRFAGLDYRSDPQEVAWLRAVDMLDVDLDEPGRVRARDGFDNFTQGTYTSRFWSVFPYYNSAGTKRVLAWQDSGEFRAFDQAGALTATSAATGNVPPAWARYGDPTSEYVYGTTSVAKTIVGYSGSGFSVVDLTVAGTINTHMTDVFSAISMDVTGLRLALSGGTTRPSRVWFSAQGGVGAWGTNDFVDVTPGDGDKIRALALWQSFMFAFKDTKYAVFYGETTDAAGDTEFNYRVVDTGVGLAARLGWAAHHTGLYFIAKDGIYRTTGGPPEKISDPIEPLWTGEMPATSSQSAIDHDLLANATATADRHRIYFAIPTTPFVNNSRLLVFDTRTQDWMMWTIQANGMTPFRFSDGDELLFAYANGANHVGRVSSAYTADDTATLAAHYRTGFADLGTPMSEKVVREWLLDGSGSPYLMVYTDDDSSVGTPTHQVSLSSGHGRHRRAYRGRNFGVRLYGEAPWMVQRLAANVRAERVASLES
jgi:hypothetical protein